MEGLLVTPQESRYTFFGRERICFGRRCPVVLRGFICCFAKPKEAAAE
jgi:hypothetical protein